MDIPAEQVLEGLGDLLSPPTRSTRTRLLVSSMVGIAIVLGGLVPTEIAGPGIRFKEISPDALLIILGLVILYYLVSFGLYASADVSRWILGQKKDRADQALDEFPDVSVSISIEKWPGYSAAKEAVTEYLRAAGYSRWVVGARIALDFILPPVVGLFALIVIGIEIS